MGVIQRQGFKQSIVKLSGVMLGFLSLLFIYPLDLKSYGNAQFLLSSAMILTPVLGMGLSQSAVKFFTSYREYTGKKKGFFNILLILHLIPFFLFTGTYLLFRSSFYGFLSNSSIDLSLIQQNETSIFIITCLVMLYSTLTMYISNYGRIVVPSIIMDFTYKLYLPLIVLLVYSGYLEYDLIAYAILFYYLVALMVLFIYAYKLDILGFQTNFSFLKNGRLISIIRFSVYSALTGLGAIVAFRIDAVMVASLLDEMSCGLYFNILVVAMIIDIPNQAIAKIAGPIISKSWTEGATDEIQVIYSKASLNSLIFGMLLFLGLAFNLEDIFVLSSNPKAFLGVTNVFLFLGFAKLVDAATGINTQILVYSKYYKFNLIFLLILAALNIWLNVLFINSFGLLGAAIATFVSLSVYNFVKYLFIKYSMGMSPFSLETIKVLIISGLVFLLVYVLPMPSSVILSILYRSTLIVLLFVSSIYFSKVSSDFNSLVDKYKRLLIS